MPRLRKLTRTLSRKYAIKSLLILGRTSNHADTLAGKYLRLKVENRGKTFAKKVSVCVTQITYKAAGKGESTFQEEVFELSLAPTAGNPYVFNLAAHGHRFMDLVHTALDDHNNLELVFDFGKGAHRLTSLNMRSGEYDAKVFASAENAASIERNVHWSYGNSLDLDISAAMDRAARDLPGNASQSGFSLQFATSFFLRFVGSARFFWSTLVRSSSAACNHVVQPATESGSVLGHCLRGTMASTAATRRGR